MGATEEYKHIKVSSASSDEVVIKAGSRVGDAEPDASANKVPKPNIEPENARVSSHEAIEKEVPQKTIESRQGSSYSPTTLEDIESSKMSKVQIAVIVIAVLAVAAFVIWYTVFA